VADALMTLRPFLLLVFVALVFWLAARVLRQSLLGRLGQLGKLLVFVGLVGIYVLTLVFTAMGAAPPWAPFMMVLMGSPLTIIVVVVSVVLFWLVLRELPFPTPHWAGFLLEGPWRGLLMPADAVFNRMALGPGMRVVELGCGTGHLSVGAARRIEPGGILFCVDIQPEMVKKTMARIEKQGLGNTQGHVASAGRLPFDIYDIDLVFVVHVLGEIPDRLAALREAFRVLRPGGVLSISETLIDPHYRFRNDVVKTARQAGFETVSVDGSLFNYTATFRRPAAKGPLEYVPRFAA
jgi:SAM-dependent methyltransferase